MKKLLVLAVVASFSASMAMAAECKKADVMKVIDQACEVVNKMGVEKMGAELMKPEFSKACDSYVWVHEAVSPTSAKMIFHPTNPQLMGRDLGTLKDPDGKEIYGGFLKIAPRDKKGANGWMTYKWAKPGVADPQSKCSYLKNCDGKHVAGLGPYADCKAIGVTDAK